MSQAIDDIALPAAVAPTAAAPTVVPAENETVLAAPVLAGETKPLAEAAIAATTMPVLVALSVSHMLNDTIQALIPAMYPVLKDAHQFSFTQIGLITFTFQLTASVLQPIVGTFTDRQPRPYALPLGMTVTLLGLLLLSQAWTFPLILVAAAMVGAGSSIFHPEASRLAHMAAGQRHGFAQSLFQLGGNFGTSLGPLLAAWIIVPRGQHAAAWFSIIAILGIAVLARVGRWYSHQLILLRSRPKPVRTGGAAFTQTQIIATMAILVLLVLSKNFYLVSFTNYYAFFLKHKFDIETDAAQVLLFVFLFAAALGTILGGPMSDRFGRKTVIWVSILGAAPFSMLLPYVSLPLAVVMSVFAGMIMASAFSTIVVYAQELVPGRVGLIAGLFFGVAFGGAGIAAAGLGALADVHGIEFVFQLCAFLPLIGVLTIFLPRVGRPKV